MRFLFYKKVVAIVQGFFLFFIARSALATDITVGLPSFARADQSPARFVAELYQYSLGIVSTAAVVMIVYGGVKYVASGGNEAAKSDAMDIIKNSIFGVLLLFGGFIILYTINPNLVNLKNPSVPVVPAPSSSFPAGGSTDQSNPLGPLSKDKIAAAKNLLAVLGNWSSVAQCGGVLPQQNVLDMAAGQYPRVCFTGCSSGSDCPRGGPSGKTDIAVDLLNGLTQLQKEHPDGFRVNSLTGDNHHLGANDPHYQGIAVDLTPLENSQAIWEAYLGYLRTAGISKSYCECGGKLDQSSCALCFKNGALTNNAHIHAQLR